MADINVERKGPSIWPWVIGLLVLALLIWAIAEMVDTDEAVDEVAEVEAVEEPPAAMPEPGMEEEAEAVEIETLMPLGPEDAGMRAEIEGTVVGEPVQDGFWVATQDNTVLFVRSDQQVESGQDIDELTGTIATAPEQRVTDWADMARLSEAEGFDEWDVQGELYLDSMDAADRAPGAQQRPDRQERPDTVEGRY